MPTSMDICKNSSNLTIYISIDTVINAVPMMRKSNDSTLGTADKKDKSL